VCAYLESWHLDVEEFLELRKNTGDDRRRTHDMNTANWIPDLFMKRVMEGTDWTLFSPSTCPDLHDTFGREFETIYTAYEARAASGEIKLHKKASCTRATCAPRSRSTPARPKLRCATWVR
jgi:ribonucleoside-diphosphate reductase alpha chain